MWREPEAGKGGGEGEGDGGEGEGDGERGGGEGGATRRGGGEGEAVAGASSAVYRRGARSARGQPAGQHWPAALVSYAAAGRVAAACAARATGRAARLTLA